MSAIQIECEIDHPAIHSFSDTNSPRLNHSMCIPYWTIDRRIQTLVYWLYGLIAESSDELSSQSIWSYSRKNSSEIFFIGRGQQSIEVFAWWSMTIEHYLQSSRV